MRIKARAVQEMAEAAGLTVLGCEITGGTHHRLRLRLPSGKETAYVTSSTPSDGRAHLNARADLRRLARTGSVRGG